MLNLANRLRSAQRCSAVLPQPQARRRRDILTDNGREYCGTTNHQYELYLELNNIEHRRTKAATPRTNGFIERFNRTILDEFFRSKMRATLYESVDQLRADLDAWLKFHNEERPHRGYRNMGKRPIDTINQVTKHARQEAWSYI
jgi:transposase InsO family protein